MHDALNCKLHIQFSLNTQLNQRSLVSPMLNSYQVKDDRRSRYPLERGTYLVRGMGPHVSNISLKYLFT